MSDVLLGQAYYLRFDPKLWHAQQPYAPLGTLYAAAYLRSRGHGVALFDAMLAESEREWAEALDRERPAVAVIYEDSFNYLTKMCLLRMREAALRMVDLARTRGCPVIVSGSDATDHPEIYLRRGAEAVILGEGEVTLADLVDRLKAGAPLTDVAGIAYLEPGPPPRFALRRGSPKLGCECPSEGGRVTRRTAVRPFVKVLDDLPFPAWDLVDVKRYRSIWRGRHGYHAMNVATTRGCPYHCNWCAKPIYGQRYAVRTPQNVVRELAWLAREYQPDQISIVDDVFGLQPGWIETFARAVQEAGLTLNFRCLMRADQINDSATRALRAAGCRMVWMGAESGSQRILDAMEKGVRVEQIHAAATLLHGAGISVGLFLQFGYPGETREDIEATLQLARDLDPEDIGVSVSYPLPRTKFYDRVREELGQKQNWVDSDDLAMMYSATYQPEFYRVLHHIVHYEFRVRRLSRNLKQALAHPFTLRGAHLRHAAALVYNRLALPQAMRRLRRLQITPVRAASPARILPMLTRGAAATPSQQDA